MKALRVAIVGAGISGLTAAYRLKLLAESRSVDLTCRLFDRATAPGGLLSTETAEIEGVRFLLENGPDSWLATKPETHALALELGLGREIIETKPENRRVFIAMNGTLHDLPDGLILGVPTNLRAYLASPLLRKRARLRALGDLVLPRKKTREGEDESIGALLTRRLGSGHTNLLAAPLLGGVYAGDAYALSVNATFPQLPQAEREHGSLIRAMQALAKKRREGKGAGMFASLRGGLQTLPRRLEERIGLASFQYGATVSAIARLEEPGFPYVVETERGAFHADHVIVTGAPSMGARLLGKIDADLAKKCADLADIATTVIVLAAYRRDQIDTSLVASGFLDPSEEAGDVVAGTFLSSKWEGRAPDGWELFRIFLRGKDGRDVRTEKDDDLAARALSRLGKLVGLRGEPLFRRVIRHGDRPQPRPGHASRVRELKARLAETKGLHLLGSGYDGIGISDCIRGAEACAQAIMASAR